MRFIHCKFCHGRGCLACDGERKKYEAAKTEKIKNWQPPSDESVSFMKSILGQIQSSTPGPRMTEEELEARVRMPEPVMSIKFEDTDDLELAKNFIGAEVLQKIADETDGDPQAFHEQFLKNAEEFRIEQGKLHERRNG